MNINEQHDGTWQVSKCVLKHSGHIVGEDVYSNYPMNKKLTEEDEEYLEQMRKAGAAPRLMAKGLSDRTGNLYSTKDVQNVIKKLRERIQGGGILEEHLQSIIKNKGDVQWSKDETTGYINVLWIQTYYD